jgi:NAD-dependent dihydropyrimidine dehydrogenase PreA subunit
MRERTHSVVIDPSSCTGCVACSKACPTRAIRVRGGVARVDPELCIDCGACGEACPHHAVRVRSSSTSDLKAFKHTVALPSLTLYTQFGPDTHPARIQRALKRLGFDSGYDISWMCAMVGSATDAYLTDCQAPWPKISVTCPAIVRLVQIRYPDLLPHLVPIETPRELAAKRFRRRYAARLGLAPAEIGLFFISPCAAIIHSIVAPVGLGESYLDGAFSIAELYGPLMKAMKADPTPLEDTGISLAGLGWAQAGGEINGMRNASTMTVTGLRDVVRVFDRLESGVFRDVDFIEAYVCPDGCLSGQLCVEGRYAARRSLRQLSKRLQAEAPSDEEVRRLLRERFFDTELEIGARAVQPVRDLRQLVARRRERAALIAQLPGKDCGACGAPDCDGLAEDIVEGEAHLEDCPFVRLRRLEGPEGAGPHAAGAAGGGPPGGNGSGKLGAAGEAAPRGASCPVEKGRV